MINRALLEHYIEKFNQHTYPTQLYQELVVEGKEVPDKFALMGAWKSASIRAKVGYKRKHTDTFYSDTNGVYYVYTDRWKHKAKVGYNTWMAINAEQELYRQRIPSTFTLEQPSIVSELVEQPGFGFIWALFVLHCYYPEEYPLYDQHVYRAYKYHESGGQINKSAAPNSWREYARYRTFFLDLKQKYAYQYWLLDRGLWALGKEIKQGNYVLPKPIDQQLNMSNQFTSTNIDESWVRRVTLGVKAKAFHWKLDDAANLCIIRYFENKAGEQQQANVSFSVEQINKIVEYVAQALKGEVALANNVEKLADGTEQEGLGRFMYEHFSPNTTVAQSSSQLAAIFVEAGIWQWNGKQIGMTFKANLVDWQNLLRKYYERGLK